MNKHFFFANQRGAFLLEALISVVILAVGLVAVIKSFTMGVNAHQRSQEYLTASVLLENKLTELLLGRYVGDETAGEGSFAAPFDRYRYVVTIVPSPRSSALRQVNVAVIWIGKKGEKVVQGSLDLFQVPEQFNSS